MISAKTLQKLEALAIMPGSVFLLAFVFYPTWRLFAGMEEGRNMGLLGVTQVIVLFCVMVVWRTLLLPNARWPGGRIKVQQVALLLVAIVSVLVAKGYCNRLLLLDSEWMPLQIALVSAAFTALTLVSLHMLYNVRAKKR